MIEQTKTVQLRGEARPVSWVTGPATQLHELAAVMRERVRAGEIEIIGPMRAHPRAPQLVVQPYIVLAPRRRLRTAHLVSGAIGVYVLSAAALAWEARHLLLTAGGALLIIASLTWLLSRVKHSGACPGLHCAGCRG